MRKIIPILALLAGALIAVAAATTPGLLQGRGGIGLLAVEAMLAIYAAAAILLAPRAPVALAIGAPIGLIAGAVYAAEILSEYAFTPPDNTPLGLAEFGTVFALFFIAGGLGAWRTGRFKAGVSTAIWTAVISALIWYAVLLAVFLAFRGSDRQLLVLKAEGDIADFQRAGGGDLARFIVEDYFGAGFYHLLLAPIVAAILGSVGAGAALTVHRLRHPRASLG
jgi:hypothetical protein